MRPLMSTQALLNELAARERRVLEQLHELSGINQSPISPQQAYASVQATPRGAQASSLNAGASSPPLSWHREEANEVDGIEPHGVRPPESSRGIIRNLEHDLERLQCLLRLSPLNEAVRQADRSNESDAEARTPKLQQYGTPQPEKDTEKAMATAREKRLRVSPVAALSSSPVAPLVKRDKRETLVYAPPPPIRPLPSPHNPCASRCMSTSGEGEVITLLDGAAPPRRSEVLDMTDEEDGRGHSYGDEVRSPRGGTAARNNAISSSLRSDGGRGESQSVDSYSTPYWQNGQPCVNGERANSSAGWSRSPVRWFAVPEESKETQCNTVQAKDNERGLCTSALDAWDAHRSCTQQADSTVATAGQLPFHSSASELSTPPPTFASFSEASRLERAQPCVFSSASPPPRFPAAPLSSPKSTLSTGAGVPNTALLTPLSSVVGNIDSAPFASVTVPRAAETPQSITNARGVLGVAAAGPFAAVSTRRGASALPRGVARAASWGGLKAFFTRQSRVSVLRTPGVSCVEDESHRLA
ncbi:hypothetical protein ABL78_1091 [Leptomonas seymouri]|uniref:Uncharacterized protein n=1 Tax=Leptomonas seymouri TaxID=5684 RepID=A0A0N1IMH2_LEPSE|nr:hypothetical protein ABL78_1091 [Leptomonas seymouri]|eukprot:KPI89828.1 hypothetical protein ABL78_1091 [Leptomonas seymouri]